MTTSARGKSHEPTHRASDSRMEIREGKGDELRPSGDTCKQAETCSDKLIQTETSGDVWMRAEESKETTEASEDKQERAETRGMQLNKDATATTVWRQEAALEIT